MPSQAAPRVARSRLASPWECVPGNRTLVEPFTLRAVSAHALPCHATPGHASSRHVRGVLGVEPKRRPSPLPNRKVPLPCLVRPCLGLSCHTRPHPEAWAFGSRTRTKTISPTAPEDALASPRRASPCQASHRQASSAPAVGIEPTVQPFGLPAARATPCHASPRPATPGLATPCLTPSVRAPDSNRRVCHPRYRSKEPLPCPA